MADETFKACVVCGKIFPSQNPRQLYCSRSCLQKRSDQRPERRKRRVNPDIRHQRYFEHLNNARAREIPFLLTFEEWWSLWEESGKWEQRGNQRGKYCMARFNDRGAYEVDNVSICLVEINRFERNQNYPMRGENNPAYGKDYWASASREERQRRALVVADRFKGTKQSAEHIKARFTSYSAERRSAAMRVVAAGRRAVIRDGRRTWAHPGDPDYPGDKT